MKTVNDLLDAAKKVTGSDYKTSEALGVDRQMISGWRHGKSKPNDEHRAVMAQITGWSLAEVVAAVNAKENPEFWENFLKRSAETTVAALLIATGIVTLATPSPAQATEFSGKVESQFNRSIHYANLRRRLQRALAWLPAMFGASQIPA